MKIKTNELTGAALDWAVAKCEGHSEFRLSGKEFGPYHTFADLKLTYSTNWYQGGPIIEREMIQLTPHCMVNPLYGWAAAYRSFDEDDDVYALFRKRGKTPLIAAMRCYVASKLGDTIDIPEELT
jgi:hypothetical protein